jgi:hypothetical protein
LSNNKLERHKITLSLEQKIDSITAAHIARCSELSYTMEIARGEEVNNRAAKTLTAISIISVGVVASIGVLPELSPKGTVVASIAYAIELLLLAISFVFCLLSQFGYKYKTLVSPQAACIQIKELGDMQPFDTEVDAATHFAASIEESYQSVRAINTRSKLFLNISLVLLIAAIGIVVLGITACAALN